MYEMGRQERSLKKRAKIDFLQLSAAEWTRVGQFTDLLSYADVAQQAFSSDRGSTLHLAIPALETLHKSWSSRAERPKYTRFARALKAAATKLDEYYERTTNSPAYIIVMCSSFSLSVSATLTSDIVLDPTAKIAYFKKHWPSNLLDDVLTCAENVFKQRYDELHQDQVLSQPTTTKSKVSGLKKLIREVQSDSEDDAEPEPGATSPSDPSKPWRAEFTSYIETIEAVQSAGMTTIQWWGVSAFHLLRGFLRLTVVSVKINGQRYPVWASLARDYLSIMAASVSSERAFSQGGITISKRRNRLKGDIVEALQCVKCSLRNDLLFREPGPSSLVEEETEDSEHEAEVLEVEAADDEGWDTLLLGDDDDMSGSDVDSADDD